MRAIWTLLKVLLALLVAVPVSIIVLATALGVLGALVGVAVFALKLAVFALVGWTAFRLISRLFSGASKSDRKSEMGALPSSPIDPHYEAAMRELDRELGPASR
ncbi:MAG TPA: hypothetical protein VJ672_06610 [Gemmatimonadaceae bacterium]|nr:hypothetical protein [Gemmatimonadaceae bacterium]